MKPITIFWRDLVPNPSKVLVILEELGLPYQTSWVELDGLKQEPYESVNPNGRVPGADSHRPFSHFGHVSSCGSSEYILDEAKALEYVAIIDPNTNTTLWETGAIVSYLIETYDKERKLTYDSVPEKFLLQQWSFFQASGQGPYFGQAAWFNFFHPEKIESAQTRYMNEIKRVVGVLDRALKGKEWLVGDKCTYADLAFVMWNTSIDYIMSTGPVEWNSSEYPNFKRWQEAMLARESVKKVVSVRQEKELKSDGRV